MTQFLACCLVAVLSAEADGAATLLPTIESMGVATVDVVPEYVVFWLHKQNEGETRVASMAEALRFGGALGKALAERELGASDVSYSAPAIEDATRPCVRVSARIRVGMARFSNRETGPGLFAGLCDDMVALAEGLGCALEGPLLDVEDRKGTESTAIGMATRDALPAAQSLAEIMSAHVVAVERVVIQECSWNDPPELRFPLPNLGRLTCTARVRVTYSFSAAMP